MKRSDLPLFEHQKTSLNFFLANPKALDFSDPGTGKTRVQIEAFAKRRKNGGRCALIVAPKSLLFSAWVEDFRKFAPHLKVVVITAKNKKFGFDELADVYVTNTDAVRWISEKGAKFFKRFDTLIIDEISAFKHATSQRSRAVNRIKKHFTYRYGMTGTPTTNSVTDIWNQVNIIDDGQRLGNSFFQFRAAVCEPRQVGPSASMIKWTDKPNIEATVGALLADIVVRHNFAECIDIPPNFQYTMPYELSTTQRKLYEQMRKHAITQLQSGEVINTVNAAGVLTKLLQIASGSAYTENSEDSPVIDSGRYELVAELAEQRSHSVVFFLWRHQRDYLIAEFKKRGITYVVLDGEATDAERRHAVADFQAGMYKVFLAHPQSAAHGLTLTRGVATIWASPTFNLEHFIQGNARVERAGQKNKTETIVVVAKDTIEEQVMSKLEAKDLRQENILEFLCDNFKETSNANKD